MKILFIDSAHSSLKNELEKRGFSCEEDFISSKVEIEKKISQYDGIILRSRFEIDMHFINCFYGDVSDRLRFIARVGAGMEHIDVLYAEKKGIICLSSPEGNRNAVAEHALGMLLSLFNNIPKANEEVKKGKWIREANRGFELEGKTIGIYGYGNTGSAFANVLRGFNLKILAYDKFLKNYGSDLVTESSPEEIFSEADVLSLHLPFNDATKYLVNDLFINNFRKNIFLINTSRGSIVKTEDLVKNIKTGKIMGACLDVVEYEESSFEKISFSGTDKDSNPVWEYLKKSDKVILTPHIAGWSVQSSEKMAKILTQKIISLTAK